MVIGGGPTGVELAGAMAELARHGMSGEFRRADPSQARVLLVEAGPRLLAAFPEALSAETERALTELGVEVRTAHQVEADGVVVAGERVAARTVIWAAGVMASPAARWLEREADRAGRLKVGPNLEVPGLAGVFTIGDTAYAEAWGASPCPDSRQPRSRVVTTWPRWCGPDWKGARRRRPSATDTRVAWPPSAAARRWWTWEGCGCRVPQPGGSGPI